MSKDTGGSAFPVPAGNFSGGEMWMPEPGLTLRDYFAAKMLPPQPYFPRNFWQAIRWAMGFRYKACSYDIDEVSTHAYRQADAMLEARKK